MSHQIDGGISSSFHFEFAHFIHINNGRGDEYSDNDKAPKLPKETVKNLSTCKFIEDKRNVILVGDSGGGKTHLAIALGVEACTKVHSVDRDNTGGKR